MPEDPELPDDEFITSFSVQFSGDDNTFATLDFLEWDWSVIKDEDGQHSVRYGIPEYSMN